MSSKNNTRRTKIDDPGSITIEKPNGSIVRIDKDGNKRVIKPVPFTKKKRVRKPKR